MPYTRIAKTNIKMKFDEILNRNSEVSKYVKDPSYDIHRVVGIIIGEFKKDTANKKYFPKDKDKDEEQEFFELLADKIIERKIKKYNEKNKKDLLKIISDVYEDPEDYLPKKKSPKPKKEKVAKKDWTEDDVVMQMKGVYKGSSNNKEPIVVGEMFKAVKNEHRPFLTDKGISEIYNFLNDCRASKATLDAFEKQVQENYDFAKAQKYEKDLKLCFSGHGKTVVDTKGKKPSKKSSKK